MQRLETLSMTNNRTQDFWLTPLQKDPLSTRLIKILNRENLLIKQRVVAFMKTIAMIKTQPPRNFSRAKRRNLHLLIAVIRMTSELRIQGWHTLAVVWTSGSNYWVSEAEIVSRKRINFSRKISIWIRTHLIQCRDPHYEPLKSIRKIWLQTPALKRKP